MIGVHVVADCAGASSNSTLNHGVNVTHTHTHTHSTDKDDGMAGKRPLATVRAVGGLIVCSHPACGDPHGAVVNQLANIKYTAAAIALHEATHPTPERADPLGGDPLPKGCPGDAG